MMVTRMRYVKVDLYMLIFADEALAAASSQNGSGGDRDEVVL